jgi:hypothetical protein
MASSKDGIGVGWVIFTYLASTWSRLSWPPAVDRSRVAPLWGLSDMSRWAIRRRKMMMSLRTCSRPERCGVKVKALPLPVGAQSGWAPLPWKKRAMRVGCSVPAALADFHMPESSTLPAPRPRRIDRREMLEVFIVNSCGSGSGGR